MKKSTMEAIMNLLAGNPATMTADECIAAVQTELDKAQSRVEANREARNAMMMNVIPIITAFLSDRKSYTSKQVYTACADQLPEGWDSRNVQWVLSHEMKDLIIAEKHEKGAQTYRLK